MSSSTLSSSNDDLSDGGALLVTQQKRKYFRSIFQLDKHCCKLKRKIDVDLVPKPDASELEVETQAVQETDPRLDSDTSVKGPLLSSDGGKYTTKCG